MSGHAGSGATGINNHGQIVGSSWQKVGSTRATRWEQGTITNLGALPGDPESVALGINDAGQIVGWSGEFEFGTRAVLWQERKIISLPELPGTNRSEARAINNVGQIVGESGRDAVLWQNGEIVVLGGCPGASRVEPTASTKPAKSSGYLARANGDSGRAVAGVEVVELGTLPGTLWPQATDINERGQIAAGP